MSGDSDDRLLHHKHSEHQSISVLTEAGLRLLKVNDFAVQSAMNPDHPHRLILPYMPPMFAWLFFRSAPRRVLLLGVGGGDLIRYMYHAMPETHLTGVDHDPAMIETARDWFDLPNDDKRMTTSSMEAHAFLTDDKHRYDVIFIDIHGKEETPVLTAEDPLFEQARAHLNSNGVVVMNMITEDETYFARSLWHLRRLFNCHTLCMKVEGHKNIIVFAYMKKPAPVSRAGLQRKVAQLAKQYDLDFDRMLQNLFTTNPTENDELMF